MSKRFRFTVNPDPINRVKGKMPEQVEAVRQLIGADDSWEMGTMAELVWGELPATVKSAVRGKNRVAEHIQSMIPAGLVVEV